MIGKVHSIESFATLDGGGIRYAIFLQGCPLRCSYCHNPDSQQFSGGKEMSPRDIVDKIKRNITFYRSGGVTISGGEPMAQSEFCIELARLVHKECQLEVAIDTSGAVYPSNIDELIDNIDLFIVDLKYASDDEYIANTGMSISNTIALLGKLNAANRRVHLRSVIMPTINDSYQYLDKYYSIIKDYRNIVRYELLGYHRLGVHKYEQLGREYKLENIPEMNEQMLSKLQIYIDNKLSVVQ